MVILLPERLSKVTTDASLRRQYFVKVFSKDHLHRKIRANIISPGTTDTPVFGRFVPAEQLEAVKKFWADRMAAGTIGQPSDIGEPAVYLAYDDSSFMLGAELLVDGGLTHLSRDTIERMSKLKNKELSLPDNN